MLIEVICGGIFWMWLFDVGNVVKEGDFIFVFLIILGWLLLNVLIICVVFWNVVELLKCVFK